MKCYICEKSLGEEAGWDVCPDCVRKYPLTAEALLKGELICIRYPKGITLSETNLVFMLAKKK